jgi:hypothetical protein
MHCISANCSSSTASSPLGRALAARNLLEPEAPKETPSPYRSSWKVMTGNALRAPSRSVERCVVHGEAFDASLQIPAAH